MSTLPPPVDPVPAEKEVKHMPTDRSDVDAEEKAGVSQREGVVGGDYSGAAEKTDPREIALVRKLDRMIMVW